MGGQRRLPPWEQIARASQMRRIAALEDLDQLRGAFRNDRTRCRFLERLRWPDGFVCARCQSRHEPRRPRTGMCVCGSCGYFRSVTNDSLFRDDRVSLERWFSLFWLLASGAMPLEPAAVARLTGVDVAEATSLLLQLGRVLERLEARPLVGVVELDAGVLDLARHNLIALIAVESFAQGFGRLRVRLVDDLASTTVRTFVRDVVEAGARLRTDCWSDYLRLADSSYEHEAVVVPPPDGGGLAGPAAALRLLRSFAKATPVSSRELVQVAVDAFVVRINRASRSTTGELFCHLVAGALQMAERAKRHRRVISGVRRIAGLGREPDRRDEEDESAAS